MRREGKPEGPLESGLVDPTGRDLKSRPAPKVLNSRLKGTIQTLSNGCGVENSQGNSARSMMGRSDVVRRVAQKVVRTGYVDRDHRDVRGPFLGALFDKVLT